MERSGELLVLPVPSVCLELSLKPFQCPSGKIKPGNESLYHVGYSLAMEQLDKARRFFALLTSAPNPCADGRAAFPSSSTNSPKVLSLGDSNPLDFAARGKRS